MTTRRPLSKWSFVSCLAICLTALALQAQTEKNLQPVEGITQVTGLKMIAPIPMATTRSTGAETARAGAISHSSRESRGNGVFSGAIRYPGDLQDQGGPTVPSATQHAIFINPSKSCPSNSCWGNPIGFIGDLSRSQFIDVTDQYVGSRAPDRYPDGANYYIPGYTPSAGTGKPFTDLDMASAAYSVAAQTNGFGTDHIYHLFLVPGQDVCFDSTFTVCYSPDNVNTWSFCAYHGSASDNAGNVVLYTVEPYQDIPGCNVRPGTPNGQLADSTNNVLSHETFETITDPLGTAWWNELDNGIYGEEIGDECSFLLFTSTSAYFDPSTVFLGHKLYAAQPEYSNALHACTTLPLN